MIPVILYNNRLRPFWFGKVMKTTTFCRCFGEEYIYKKKQKLNSYLKSNNYNEKKIQVTCVHNLF